VALTELEADPAGQAPGRFGFDEPELALHQAEAHLTLGRAEQARTRAEASAAACTTGTPGWAAATLGLAQAEAFDQPSDAAQRALDVLDRVPPSHLRTTARTRLERLNGLLAARPAEYVADLRERLRRRLPLTRPAPHRRERDLAPGTRLRRAGDHGRNGVMTCVYADRARGADGRLSEGMSAGMSARSGVVLSLRDRGRVFVVALLVGAGCCASSYTRPRIVRGGSHGYLDLVSVRAGQELLP
jgi:hypothetical protein